MVEEREKRGEAKETPPLHLLDHVVMSIAAVLELETARQRGDDGRHDTEVVEGAMERALERKVMMRASRGGELSVVLTSREGRKLELACARVEKSVALVRRFAERDAGRERRLRSRLRSSAGVSR